MNIDELIIMINRSSQHRYLYHFTDEANFATINTKGLVSKERMRRENWWPATTGGNQWSHNQDTARGIDPYVSLCFTCNHPMKYVAHLDGRLPNPRYLKISPEVLQIPGVQIATGIANANATQILPLDQAIKQLDTEVIYTRTDWSDAGIHQRLVAAEKFEVLVPHGVPRDLIKGVI